MPIEIVDFPIDSMVIFNSFLYVYQRGTIIGYLENPLWIFMAGKSSNWQIFHGFRFDSSSVQLIGHI